MVQATWAKANHMGDPTEFQASRIGLAQYQLGVTQWEETLFVPLCRLDFQIIGNFRE